MQDNAQLAVVIPDELQKVVSTEVGVSKDKATEHMVAFAPFVTTITELSQEMEGINYDNPSAEDASKARSIRLKLVPNRTAAEKEKDLRKKSLLAEGGLIQSLYNVVANASKMKEEQLAAVEKFAEIQEQNRIAKLIAERMEQLSPFNAAVDPRAVGSMDEDTFKAFLSGIQAQHEQKIAAEKAEEEARRKVEEQRLLNGVRMKALVSVWNFLTTEESELSFGEMTEDQFESLQRVVLERKQEHDHQEQLKEAELEKERAIQRQKEAEMQAERERIAAEQAKIEAEKQRIEYERLEAERKKRDEEEAQKLAEAKAEKERKADLRKANNAPELDKLKLFLEAINAVEMPKMKSEEGIEAAKKIENLRKYFNERANEELEKLV